jgi:ABC-type branched-subunit amino acid transport system ATPase component
MSQQHDADASTPALQVSGLVVRYGGFRAVDGLDLTVPRGSVHGLIGPNGAGKTSSFNAICGYVQPSAGNVSVHGQPFTKPTPRRAWKLGIGRTFQRVELFWTLTVAEHLELASRRAALAGRVPPGPERILDLFGLSEIAGSVVASLPLGTCRLVELARAISTGSDVILLDEPCSGLDRAETSRLQASLDGLRAELGLTLLIVEHDLEFILDVADQLTVLDSGTPIAHGTPAEIRDSAAVRAAYLGEPISTSNDAQKRAAS